MHGFLGGATFATYHAPSEPGRSVGYVICPPLGYEAIECYHSLLRLAQGLATAGFHTVRVEYHGTGESLGSDEDPGRVAAWLDSIRRAVGALREIDQVEAIGLIGLRIGATFAAKVASETEVDRLVLWHPCASGAMYTREVEIMASAAAKALGSPELESGVEAAGYLLTSETIADLASLRVDQPALLGRPDVLVIDRDDRPSVPRLGPHYATLNCAVTVEKLPGYKQMMVDPAKSLVPHPTLERIRSWAIEHSSISEKRPTNLALSEYASDGLVRQRAVRFGPDERLLGVLTEPMDATGPVRANVILLAGGVVPRTAVNRMYVPLARRLAELGHRVLRVDVSGIGESFPVEGADPNDPYAESLLGDVVAALEWTSSGGRAQTTWLIGLCSGAYASFQTALNEPRVVGTVLINPLVFYWKRLSTQPPTVHDAEASMHYGRSLLSASKWKKLLAGKVDLRYAIGNLTAPVRNRLASQWGRDLPKDLSSLLSRGVAVNLAFSDGDPGYRAFVDQVGRRMKQLQRDGLVLEAYRGADHTFSPMHVRRELLGWIVGRVSTDSQSTSRVPMHEM